MRTMSLGFFPSYIDMDALPSKLWTQCKQHTTNKRRNHSKHVANFQHICTLEKKQKKHCYCLCLKQAMLWNCKSTCLTAARVDYQLVLPRG